MKGEEDESNHGNKTRPYADADVKKPAITEPDQV